MPTESTRPLARSLLRVVLGPGEVADRDLLARFATTRDEEAFVELVRRHGPMVLGVCRRVTGHPHDAEDAFQAAFVVLARRAAQVKHPEQLANWLYGVAYRTALEARTARRRVQEQPVSAAPEPAAPPEPDDTADLRKVIDEELAKLPDKYRSAVVLCDLEGLPRADAAARLKIPEGTLSSRLAYARKVLAQRLTRRGVTASAAALATTLGRDATAAVPRDLVMLTARVAARATAGGTVPPCLVPESVSTLADGVMKTMLANRLRLTLGLMMTCGVIGLGAYGLAQVPSSSGTPSVPLPMPTDAPRVYRTVVDPTTGGVQYYEQVAQNASGQTKQQEPPKVAAKGIEDEDVPFTNSPSQAVVRLEEGKLIVRQRSFMYVTAVQTQSNYGQPVTSYQRKSGVHASTYDPADISVFDMKGNRLQPKAWKDKFKADVHALVAFDGKLPHPRELTLFKEDTLLVVLPTPPAITAYGVNAPDAPAMIAPPPTPATPAHPAPAPTPRRPGSVTPPASTQPVVPRDTLPRSETAPEPVAPPVVVPEQAPSTPRS